MNPDRLGLFLAAALISVACAAPTAPAASTVAPATGDQPKQGGAMVFGSAKDVTTPHPTQRSIPASS